MWIFCLQRNAIERGWEALVYSYLTNKEASTVLCSVVKHTKSGRARKKCRGKHATQLLIINRDNSMVFSVVVLFLKYNFYFRNRSFWYLSSKNLLGWEFISLSVLSESSKTCYFRTVFTLRLSMIVSMSHFFLLTNGSFLLILSESHRGCLNWVKFFEITKQTFESQLNL